MYNHFRTLLLNESYVDYTQEENGECDYVPASFLKVRLSTPLAHVYDLLFPTTLTLEQKRFYAWNYINLIKAAGLYPELKKFDFRVIENLAESSRYFNQVSAGTLAFDFDKIWSSVEEREAQVRDMLAEKASLDTAQYEETWRRHPNRVYRLASLLLALVARIDNLPK